MHKRMIITLDEGVSIIPDFSVDGFHALSVVRL